MSTKKSETKGADDTEAMYQEYKLLCAEAGPRQKRIAFLRDELVRRQRIAALEKAVADAKAEPVVTEKEEG